MGLFDTILKQLIADDAPTFAAWLLDAPVDLVEPLTVEQLEQHRRFPRSWPGPARCTGDRLLAMPAQPLVDCSVGCHASCLVDAVDQLLADARRRRFDVVVCWRLDRLGRNLRHLILLLDELHAVGVGFVTLGEGIDTTSPSGRLVLHVLGAIAEFERERLRERVLSRAG